jgi:DNA-binding response OmpR family regulator
MLGPRETLSCGTHRGVAMSRILLIDDDTNQRFVLDRTLGRAGFEVVESGTGMTGLTAALAQDFDLIVLDLTLPDVAGEHVLDAILTSKPSSRVLVLSAVTDLDRRVAVLNGGAIDFVAKPFLNAELIARIRLRMRGDPEASRSLKGAGIELDLNRRVLITGGKRVGLSQREFVLLAHLMDRKGKVCSRQELLSTVWDLPFDPGTNVVEVYVGRLRAKLAEDSIETIRNVGYRLVA